MNKCYIAQENEPVIIHSFVIILINVIAFPIIVINYKGNELCCVRRSTDTCTANNRMKQTKYLIKQFD